mmetsp:Transcript_19773/g.74753  ORF Transcript_19773/g.74753 Transcript_19773/m.74753 type:complete len:129 (+) Transcript_19773:179-565(+)
MGSSLSISAVVGGVVATILLSSAYVINLQEKPQFLRRNRLKIMAFGLTWQCLSLIYAAVLLLTSVIRGREWLRVAASHSAAEGISKLLCTVFFGEVRAWKPRRCGQRMRSSRLPRWSWRVPSTSRRTA